MIRIEKVEFAKLKKISEKKLIILALFLCTFIIYGFSLPSALRGTPHFSPSNDFSNHAHMMYRFAESFKSGQIIPRTVVSPTIFGDATVATPDIPTFQYYGTFEGMAGLPFHLLGMSDTTSAVLSSILIRFLGLVVLFETCCLLGASSLSSFLACFSLLISPYTLSVFYGRGALAETFALSLLTLILYGYALAYRNRTIHAIVAFAMAFFLIPLCHNIFFLYGSLMLAILAGFTFNIKMWMASACGMCLGLLMSAWQWLPVQNTVADIIGFGQLNSWKLGATVQLHAATLNGALGILKPYLPDGYDHAFPIYFTVGWWTIPCILLASKAIFSGDKKRFVLPIVISAAFFFALTFWPFNEPIFKYLPHIFSMLQDASRLLGFVSLLGAICLALAIPKINPRLFKVIIMVMFISQVPIFICYTKLVTKQNFDNDHVRGAPINYYYTNPKAENDLASENLLIKKSEGSLYEDNKFYVPPEKHHRFFMRLKGIVGEKDEHVKISIIALKPSSAYEKYILNTHTSEPVVIKNNFSIIIEMPVLTSFGWYKLQTVPEHHSVVLTQIDLIPDNLENFIFPENLDYLENPVGYTRLYQIKKDKIADFKPDAAGYYAIELPIAYSKLFFVEQDKIPLLFSPDFNHRIVIHTKDLLNPIKVYYKLDYKSMLLTCLGVLGFMMLLAFDRVRKSLLRANDK